MDNTETHAIELSRAEAREVIIALSEFKETAAARSESGQEIVINIQNRFEECSRSKTSELQMIPSRYFSRVTDAFFDALSGFERIALNSSYVFLRHSHPFPQ